MRYNESRTKFKYTGLRYCDENWKSIEVCQKFCKPKVVFISENNTKTHFDFIKFLIFRVSLNLAILYLSEKGELKKLENKWWYDRGQCDTGTSDGGTSSSLNLSKVAGIFYILLAGMVLSMCTALVEFLFRKNKENREKERNRMRSSRPLKPGILASCERAKQKQLQNRRTKSEEVSTPRSTLF